MSDSEDTKSIKKFTAAHVVCWGVIVISLLAALYKLIDAMFLDGFEIMEHHLCEMGIEEDDAFGTVFVYAATFIFAWLYVAIIAKCVLSVYEGSLLSDGAACILALLCLPLGNALQNGAVLLFDFFLQSAKWVDYLVSVYAIANALLLIPISLIPTLVEKAKQ